MAYEDRKDYRHMALESDDRSRRGLVRADRPPARRHGDPYGEVFSRSLHEDHYRRRANQSGPGEGVRYRGRGRGYGDPDYIGGYGSDRGRVSYALSGREGGFDDDDRLFDPDHLAASRSASGAYGGQKGGLAGGYGQRRSGERREQAAVAGAFGGRTGGGRFDMTGRGPKGYVRSDERIHDAVCEALTDAPDLDATDVEVAVGGGEVTLAGSVDERADRRLAEDIAAAVSGVRHVRNDLRIRERNPQELS